MQALIYSTQLLQKPLFENFVSFHRELVKKAWVSTYRKLNNGQKLKIRMRETSKVFNRIPLLALVNNRTRQNDGRISLQKQTSNDKRQSNLTKLGITMLFVSEKVLLFDPKSFRRQECFLTLWSRNLHIAWFYVFRVLFWRVSCVARKHLPKEKFTSFWRSFLRQFTYVIWWNSE